MTTLDIGTWHEYVEPDEVKNIWQVQNVPMAAGLQLIFYRNKAGKVIFKPLYLEKHVDLPLTPIAPHFYDWEELILRQEPHRMSRDMFAVRASLLKGFRFPMASR